MFRAITGHPDYEGEDWWFDWHHVAYTKNGTLKKIYVDGILLGEEDDTLPLPGDIDQIFFGAEPTLANSIVGDAQGAAQATTVSVTWASNNTWASTGRGEENNGFSGADRTLMLGYLHTGAPRTTTVEISTLPPELVDGSYDLYVYALGGVAGRGGAYRILNADNGDVLRDYVLAQSPEMPAYFVQVPDASDPEIWGAGDYMLFCDLNAPNIVIEATTDDPLGFGSPARAPINAVQLVAPATCDPPVPCRITYTFDPLRSSRPRLCPGPWPRSDCGMFPIALPSSPGIY